VRRKGRKKVKARISTKGYTDNAGYRPLEVREREREREACEGWLVMGAELEASCQHSCRNQNGFTVLEIDHNLVSCHASSSSLHIKMQCNSKKNKQ
jgi:hypothetical protein